MPRSGGFFVLHQAEGAGADEEDDQGDEQHVDHERLDQHEAEQEGATDLRRPHPGCGRCLRQPR